MEILQNEGYLHLAVNHKYNFVDPNTETYTNLIERCWWDQKSVIQKMGPELNYEGHVASLMFFLENTQKIWPMSCFLATCRCYVKTEQLCPLEAWSIAHHSKQIIQKRWKKCQHVYPKILREISLFEKNNHIFPRFFFTRWSIICTYFHVINKCVEKMQSKNVEKKF